VVTIASASPDPGNQDRNIFVMIESVPGETSITSGQWRLQFRSTDAASTEVDAWLIDGTGDNRPQARFGAPTVRNERKVGSPGAATKAITVASYTSRIEWASEAGPVGTDAALGEVSSFSSEGPRRDDVAKPDVMAPGSWLVSARSADATFPAALRVDGRHVALQGTSMATPFVTGLAALMLNEKPVSTAAQLKKRLVNACRPADGEPAAFEPKTGHGLIDTSLIWS
jgi:subtilisin family serine protease